MEPLTSRLQPSGKVFFACGLWLVALGAYFLFLRPALLPEARPRSPRAPVESDETSACRAAGSAVRG